MHDHPLLVGVRDRARFELLHVGEGALRERLRGTQSLAAERVRNAATVRDETEYAQAGRDGFFDDAGYPTGTGWDAIDFPNVGDPNAYALEISGDSMEPVYRDGDIIIVSPAANVRRGDRVRIDDAARADGHDREVEFRVRATDGRTRSLRHAVRVVAEATGLPISIDSPHETALPEALKVCGGKPLINSVTGERASMERVLPLVKEYDASVIALTMDDDGIPDAGDRCVDRAEVYNGIGDDDGCPDQAPGYLVGREIRLNGQRRPP